MRILVVEDEPAISGFIKKGLEEHGFQVMQAFDGEMALRLLRQKTFDIILLDLILPGINGLKLCKTIREELQLGTPVLMLTALNETEDVVAGLESGADDYLAKPFKFKELLARLRALSRRNNQAQKVANLLHLADLSVDLDRKKVSRAGENIQLTPKEFLLLEFLMRNKNRVVSRAEILESVWDVQFDTGTNVVEVYMNYLRKKIDHPYDKKLIQTVVGMGYVLAAD